MDPIYWDVEREIFSLGPFTLRWYSLLFAGGFGLGYLIVQRMFKKEGRPAELCDALLLYLVIGTIAGARIGHCFFYEFDRYWPPGLDLFKVWEGGLASHGGYIGVILALILFSWRHREHVSFLWIADRIAIPCLLEGGLIRIGNLFNSEIIGRPADVPWAFVMAKVDQIPRHPSQLYEAAGYLCVFGLGMLAYRIPKLRDREGFIFGMILVTGMSFRMFVETFKENQEVWESGMWLNMGQALSIPFILFGLALMAGFQYRVNWMKPALSAKAKEQQAGKPAKAGA